MRRHLAGETEEAKRYDRYCGVDTPTVYHSQELHIQRFFNLKIFIVRNSDLARLALIKNYLLYAITEISPALH